MKKIILLTFVAIFSFNSLTAQEIDIDFKKGFVLFDKVKVMEYRIENWNKEFYLYHLGKTDEDEIVLLLYRDNNTDNTDSDDYTKIYFPATKRSLEISQVFMFKDEIIKLIRKKVISRDGSVSEEKLDAYIERYDEPIPCE